MARRLFGSEVALKSKQEEVVFLCYKHDRIALVLGTDKNAAQQMSDGYFRDTSL